MGGCWPKGNGDRELVLIADRKSGCWHAGEWNGEWLWLAVRW